MKKGYLFTIILLIIILGFLIGIGSSFAYFQVKKVQSKENVILSNCFSVEFYDDESKINLVDAIPVSDDVGNGYKKYSFNIKNTCDTNAYVDVNQELLPGNTLSNTLIKSVLDDNEAVLLTEENTKIISAATAAYKVGTFFLKANSSSSHTVGLWVSDVADVNNTLGKVVNTQISVVARATNNNE